MQNETAFDMMKRVCMEQNAKPDFAFTNWIQKIVAAKVVYVDEVHQFMEDESLIQIRKMRENDFTEQEISKFQEPEHEYERSLDVIKLPLAVPTFVSMLHPLPEFLFIRPDEYRLFELLHVGYDMWYILTGNPGISKSWFQWKFILFCYRKELFNELWLDRNKTQGADKSEEESKNVTNPEKKIKLGEMKFPKYIIRVTPGSDSIVFFVEHPDLGVFKMNDLQSKLQKFQTEGPQTNQLQTKELTILWEPGKGLVEVSFVGVIARIIATMSPDIRRYKAFRNEGAQKVYLPCPSELQLQWMGIIFRSYALIPEHGPSVESIHERVQDIGPFIRQVLISKENERNNFIDDRIEDITNLRENLSILKRSNHIENDQKGNCTGLSHRLVCFTVDREHDSPYGYSSMSYKLTCDEMSTIISLYYGKMTINKLVEDLMKMNSGRGKYVGACPIALEYIFEKYYRGVQWKSISMDSPRRGENSPTSLEYTNFDTKFNKVERKATEYRRVKNTVLYYPDDPTFPLVDFYYKGPDKSVVGIQATIAKIHAKSISVYNSFYERIGVHGNDIQLHLYYLILPRNIASYNQGPYNRGRFIKNASDENDIVAANAILRNTAFYALVPPKNFASRYQ